MDPDNFYKKISVEIELFLYITGMIGQFAYSGTTLTTSLTLFLKKHMRGNVVNMW